MPVRDGGHRDQRLPQFRIALNARCGRACFFCRPSGEAVTTAAGTDLKIEALIAVAAAVRAAGIGGVKLTGGDPALYGPLEEAVVRLRREVGFDAVEVISRHPSIGDRAAILALGGVTQFTMSIDTLDASLHREICGVDDLPEVVAALRRCVATAIPVKVNMVVMGGVNDGDVMSMADFCAANGVRTLKLLDVIRDLDEGAETFARRLAAKRGKRLSDLYAPLATFTKWFSGFAVKQEIRTQGGLGHPMTVVTLPSGLEVMVKDSRAGAWYGPVCDGCPFFPCHDALMALRLTADLRLQFCLLRHDVTIDLSNVVHDGDRLAAAVDAALQPYIRATFREPSDDAVPALEEMRV